MKNLVFNFDQAALTVAPSPFLEARETSALAALEAAPKAGSLAAQMLTLIEAAGEAGVSDPELERAMKIPRSTVCARRNDIRVFLVPADRRAITPYGKACTCWRRASDREVAVNREREASRS